MMPAGRYFVGDLSLVLEKEWDEIARLAVLSGEFILSTGKVIAVYEVPENGVYITNQKTTHKIKSSTFGCCKVNDIQFDWNLNTLQRIGYTFDFTEPFTTYKKDDSIVLGHIRLGPLK